MGVAAEIAQRMLGTAEGRFGVDHPVVAIQRAKPGRKRTRLGEWSESAMEAEFAGRMQLAQARDKLAAEDTAEHFDWQEEAVLALNPATVIEGQATGRNDAVDVRVKQQLLIPGVQHAEESNLRAEVFGIARHREQSLRGRAKQQIIDFTFVSQGERRKLVGQRENDMRVAGRQQFAAARGKPAIARIGLALGAVPVAGANGDLSITRLMGSLF